MVDIQVGSSKSNLKILIDSGSTFNLIATDVAEKLIRNGDARKDKASKDMPVIRVANGKKMEASMKIWMKMYIGKDYTSEVPFYAFGGLPLDAIIGNDLCHQWKAVLSWEEHTWSISTKENKRTYLDWESVYGKYWRGAEDLIAKIDFIIPPKSHSKIEVRPIPGLLNQGIQGDFAFVSGQQKHDAAPFKTAYGTSTLKPEWVQVANPTENPILIRKGEIVGRLHPREQPEVAQAEEIDVNAEDLKQEKEIMAKTATARKKRDAEAEKYSEQAFVRLTREQCDEDPDKEHMNTREFQPTWCTYCEKSTCKARTEQENLLWEEKKAAIARLGINIQDTANQTTQCELEKLVDFCLTQDKVINSHGKLSPERVIPHDTALSIELTETPRFKARPQKTTPQTKTDIEQMVKEKLEQGIIEKSSAPWSSNCVVIRKDGKTRIAVDYRKLNSITVKDSYLLPKISEIFDALHGTTWFTSIDCTQACHQLPMRTEQDKELPHL